jgi:Mrp family chromosome partitioning ATPase
MRSRWWLVGATVAVAVAVAVGASGTQANRYQASAIMLFGLPSFESTAPSGGAATGTGTPQDQATDLELASLDTVAAGVRQRLGKRETLDQIKNAVTVTPVGNSNLVSVTATSSGPNAAAQLANAFAEQIVAFRRATAQNQIQQGIDALNAQIAALTAAASRGSGGGSEAKGRQLQGLRGQLTNLESLKSQQTGDVQVVQPAPPPTAPASHHMLRNGLIAGIIGLIIGLLIAMIRGMQDERVQDEPELASLVTAPVLARIPKLSDAQRRGHTWSPQDDGAFLEAFELLRLNLQLSGLQKDGLVVGVTSPAAGDGKTTVVASLARSLALSGSRVVAVDFDLRDPMLHRAFDVGPDAASRSTQPRATVGPIYAGRGTAPRFDLGRISTRLAASSAAEAPAPSAGTDEPPAAANDLLEALVDPGGGGDRLRATEYSRLHILSAGRTPAPPGFVAHDRLRLLFSRLREQSDYVLVDTSPVATRADASAVAAGADGVILVVDPQRLRRRELLAVKRQLTIAGSTIIGIVINRARTSLPPLSAAGRLGPSRSDGAPTAFSG